MRKDRINQKRVENPSREFTRLIPRVDSFIRFHLHSRTGPHLNRTLIHTSNPKDSRKPTGHSSKRFLHSANQNHHKADHLLINILNNQDYLYSNPSHQTTSKIKVPNFGNRFRNPNSPHINSNHSSSINLSFHPKDSLFLISHLNYRNH